MGDGYFRAIQYDLEDLLRELSTQCLKIKSGLEEEQQTGAIYASHPVATDLESILWLRSFALGQADPDIRERALRTYFACVGQFLRMDLLLRDQAFAQFMLEAKVQVDSQNVSLAEMEGWLMSQEDFSRREAVLLGARPLFQKASLIKAKIWEGLSSILQEDFGYKGYLEFFEEKKELDLGALAAECMELLDTTRQHYTQRVIPWIESRLGMPAASVSHLHMLRLMQSDSLALPTGERETLKAVKALLEGLGFEGVMGSRIHLDAEPREGKTALSRCVPLSVPHEIHVTLKPLGGVSDLEAAFHELGHALQLAYADPNLEYPYRHLPRSYALTECFGFLMEGVARDPEFLALHTGLSEKEAEALYLERSAKRIYVIRRYAGKLLFEREFLSQACWSDWSGYPRWLGSATGMRYESCEALLDLEEELYSADYLRAWAGEVLLRSQLREKFGARWFMSREAGEFLRGLWSRGERFGLEELLGSLGLKMPRVGILGEDFRKCT
jgi:hypothetical protein